MSEENEYSYRKDCIVKPRSNMPLYERVIKHIHYVVKEDRIVLSFHTTKEAGYIQTLAHTDIIFERTVRREVLYDARLLTTLLRTSVTLVGTKEDGTEFNIQVLKYVAGSKEHFEDAT